MTRAMFAALALVASVASLSASPWPEFPQRPDPVTAQDVKDHWFQALPRPEKPRPLDPFYQSKIKDYQYDIAAGRSLIRRLLAGFFDHEAQLTALRHNLLLYQAGGLASQASDTEATIALLLNQGPPHTTTTEFSSRLGRSSGLRLARLEPSYGLRPPSRPRPTAPPAASSPSSPDQPAPAEPEIIYIEDTDDSQQVDPCPPRPPHRPPHRPRPPLDEKPYPQVPDPPSPPAKPTPHPPESRPAPSSRPTSFFDRSNRSSR